MTYHSDIIDVIRDALNDKNEKLSELQFSLALIVDAASDYAQRTGHGRACPFERCDCGYEKLVRLIAEVGT